MPFLLYLSVCLWGFCIFRIVFRVRKATLIFSLKSLVIFLTSLLLYMKVTHFFFWCWGYCVRFVFAWERGSQLSLCYTRYCVICFWWCLFLCLSLFLLSGTCAIDLIVIRYLIVYVHMMTWTIKYYNNQFVCTLYILKIVIYCLCDVL